MRIFKEPIFYFLIIGGLIFLLDHLVQKNDIDRDVILITTEDVERLKMLYAQNWNEEPDGLILENLIDQYVSAEIYYREALKLNLDHNDEIIKRRLKQKYEFLAQDLADTQDPPEQTLLSYYIQNPTDYMSGRKYSYLHFFINPDKHDHPENYANDLLNKVKNSVPDKSSEIGDASHIQNSHNEMEIDAVRRIFGLDFARQLENINEPGWQSVFQSGLGYHLLYITEILESESIPFDKIKDQVLLDWKATNRQQFKEVLLNDLKKNYQIIIDYEQ